MDKESLIQRTRGIVVFAVTPFTEAGQVDEDGVRANMEFLAAAGIPVVVACGGVGELWHLDDDEHRRVVEAAVDQSAGRMAVYAGACGDTDTSIAAAARIENAGADGVLLFPDDDVVADAASAMDYYAGVSDAVDIGLMPFRADAYVDLDVLRRLADLPNVVALKEERENMDDFRQIVLGVGDRMSIIGAGDAFAPCYFVLGAAGLACSLSNFLPGLYLEMWAAAQAWDYRRVMEIHASLEVFSGLRRRHGTAMLKAALEIRGLAGGPCRAGLDRLPAADRAALSAALDRFAATAATAR